MRFLLSADEKEINGHPLIKGCPPCCTGHWGIDVALMSCGISARIDLTQMRAYDFRITVGLLLPSLVLDEAFLSVPTVIAKMPVMYVSETVNRSDTLRKVQV
jgi:hypothetical protein